MEMNENKKAEISREGEVQEENIIGSSGLEETNNMFMKKYSSHAQRERNKKSCKWKLRRILQNIAFQIFITIISLYSLFSDDIRIASTSASADLSFDIVHIILIVIFMIEIILNWIAVEEYRLSFYFFLDLISGLSILLDISMLTNLMYMNNGNSQILAAQNRATRVATRAVRIVKLVRIIRIVKLYKAASKAADTKDKMKQKMLLQSRKKQELKSIKMRIENRKSSLKGIDKIKVEDQIKNDNKMELSNDNDECVKARSRSGSRQSDKKRDEEESEEKSNYIFSADMMEEISQKESKISKILSQLTIQKIIIVVLLLMFIVPLFDVDVYLSKTESLDFDVQTLNEMLQNINIPTATISKAVENIINNHNGNNYIIYLATPFQELPFYQHQRYGKERILDITTSVWEVNIEQIQNLRSLTLREGLLQEDKIIGVMNYRYNSQRDAIFSIAKTTFVCIVLLGLLYFFTEDINELIVAPIENMMKQVMEMAKNPESAAMSIVDNNKYETGIVHNAIVKIGALLSLVFGSAGAEIIGSNIMQEGDMNPMIEGKKKCAIFGFCDIRNFTEVTELLQEDIMMFVNKIGELVHSSVYRYGGSANKNIGEAFLMVWPLHDQSYNLNKKTNQITWKDMDHVSLMADFSVFSFVKAIVKIHKDPTVLEYKHDARLISALGTQFQVKMGFGLHIGWAIEGAIGSEYKIDASYLSPNVNMASRLEAATRQYGINLLISEDLYKMLTQSLKKFCRNIDRVTVKGSAKPIRLYTIDLKLDNISPSADKTLKYKHPDEQLDVEIKKQINMEFFEEEKRQNYDAEEFIRNKKELREVIFHAITDNFKKRFEMGLDCYLEGNWSNSRLHLNEALKFSSNDGPTKSILNYMKKNDYVAPETWKNYRPLTQK